MDDHINRGVRATARRPNLKNKSIRVTDFQQLGDSAIDRIALGERNEPAEARDLIGARVAPIQKTRLKYGRARGKLVLIRQDVIVA